MDRRDEESGIFKLSRARGIKNGKNIFQTNGEHAFQPWQYADKTPQRSYTLL